MDLDDEVKKLLWENLDEVVRSISYSEKRFIGKNFNGHILVTPCDFDDGHGSLGMGLEWKRNFAFEFC